MLTVIVTSTSFFDFSFLKLEFLVLRIIYRGNSVFMKNISFLKLRSAEIYYKLPESCIKPLRLREFKLFAKGMDLFSIDNVNETDPEVIWSTYPAQRSVHFGFDLAF